MNEILQVEDLTFAYGGKPVLSQVSFQVKEGAFLGIAGPNGAGKTTLLNLLCGLLKPQAGSIRICGRDINCLLPRELATKIAVVRQEFVPVFEFTVAEVVLMARTPYLSVLGFEGKSDYELAMEALELTDTAEFANRPLSELSGGERQRVFIARAIAQDTPVLLLDEPTSFLDLKHQVAIYDLLKKMQLEKGKTIVVVTHDINLAAQYCEKVLLLYCTPSQRCFRIGGAGEVFSKGQIEQAFGISTFSFTVGNRRFFLPLGKFTADPHPAGKSDQAGLDN